MSSTKLFRYGGLAGMISGVAVFFYGLLPVNPLTSAVDFVGPALGLLVLTAAYVKQREESGKLGFAGYTINFLGLVLITCIVYLNSFIFPFLGETRIQELRQGPVGLVFLVTLLVFLVGVVLYSIATLRAGVFSRVAAVLYLAGFVSVVVGSAVSPLADAAGHSVAGLGVTWFGYQLWSNRMSSGAGRVSSEESSPQVTPV